MAFTAVGFLVSSAMEGVIAASMLNAGFLGTIAMAIGGTSVLAGAIGGLAGMALRAVVGSSSNSAGQSQTARAANTGIIQNVTSTVEPIPVIYGTRRIGGTRVFIEVTGATNKNLWMVIVHCEGEIDGAGTTYTFDSIPATDSRFSGFYQLTQHTGSDAQTVDAGLAAAVPSLWDSTHTLNGIVYTVVKLTYDRSAWSGIPTLGALLKGKLIYDPRSSTTAYSDNPALAIRDYLTNARYGRGLATSVIDDASFIAAANYCDAIISDSYGGKRYTLGAVVDTSARPLDNVIAMLATCRGYLVYTGGMYSLVLDRPKEAGDTPFDFNESNITGNWTISQPNKRSKFNQLKATWINPANDWQPDIMTIDLPTERAAEDNGLLLSTTFDLSFVTNAGSVARIGMEELKQSRYGITVKFTALPEGVRARAGNLITITHPTPGWTAKLFRVMTITVLDNDEIEITAREHDESVYTYTVPGYVAGGSPTSLPNPFYVAPPTALVLASGDAQLIQLDDGTLVPRILMTWAGSPDSTVRDYEIQWRIGGAGAWDSAVASDMKYAIAPVVVGQSYNVRLRARNAIGAVSSWVTGSVTATGTVTAPASVTGFALTYDSGLITLAWTPNSETNISYYEARVGASWAAGVRVGRALTSMTHRITTPGTYQFWLAAVNNSGLASAAVAQSITVSVPAALSGITVTPGVLNGYFQCTVPTEKDFAGIQIWLSTTPSFTPGAGNLVYDGPSTATVISKDAGGSPLVSGTTYYLKAAAYSSLTKTGLLASADYSFVPSAAGGVPVFATVGALPASPADGTVASVTFTDKLYRYAAGTGWVTWVDGSDLVNASVTAGKITTTSLAAISANLGAITAGNITMDAAGFIKGGQSAYNTGAGFWLGYDGSAYKFSLGNPATQSLKWDGSNLSITSPQFTLLGGSATFSGALSAASGTFTGALSAATGTFAGTLSAAGGTFSGALSAATGTFSGTLTASAINAVNTLNIAGEAVTVPRSATGTTSATTTTADFGTSAASIAYAVVMNHSGGQELGDGCTYDINLYRNGAGPIKTTRVFIRNTGEITTFANIHLDTAPGGSAYYNVSVVFISSVGSGVTGPTSVALTVLGTKR